jgi:hypothetical protein
MLKSFRLTQHLAESFLTLRYFGTYVLRCSTLQPMLHHLSVDSAQAKLPPSASPEAYT